jgi:hypothetical protein
MQGISRRYMEYVTGLPVPHHRAEPPVPRRHSDRLLSKAAGLISSSIGELAITAFLLHGCASLPYSLISQPKPGASRPPPGAGPAIRCRSTPPSVLLFGRLLHGTTAAWPKDDATPQVITTSRRTTTVMASSGSTATTSAPGGQ